MWTMNAEKTAEMDFGFSMIAGKTAYMDLGLSVIGLYFLNDREAVLLDSGPERMLELVEGFQKQSLHIRAVICSHLHPDHIANNWDLVRQFGTELYADEAEIKESEKGAWPLSPEGTQPPPLIPIPQEDHLNIDGCRFQIIRTPGHTRGHLCVVTPDGVCFTGDSIITEDVLRTAKLPYMEDVDRAIESMETLRETKFSYYVVPHKGLIPYAQMQELVDLNVEKEIRIYNILRSLVTGPISREALIDQFLESLTIRKSRTSTYEAYVRIKGLRNGGEVEERDRVVYPAGWKEG